MRKYNEQNERYQQVFNFCSFVISTFACFILIIVSTQYVRIRTFKNERIAQELLTKNEQKSNENDIDDERWILPQHEVDFETLIFTRDGLAAFLDHLAREFQLNYLVFAMEVTQYKSCVIPTLQRSKTYMAFTQKLESSMLAFAEHPKSSIVFPINGQSTTQRRMFIELFEKYIDDMAQWKIEIGQQCKNELVELYRRCKMARTKMFSVYGAGAHGTILSMDTIHDGQSVDIELGQLPSIATMHSNSNPVPNGHGVVDPKDLKAMIEALDNALNDVIGLLKKSFDKYKQTEDFSVWFAHLKPKQRIEITRKFNYRKNVQNAIRRRRIATVDKEWQCKNCTLMNRSITINNKLTHPKNICRCCGELNCADVETVVSKKKRAATYTYSMSLNQKHAKKHTKSMKDSLVLDKIMSHIVEETLDFETEFHDDAGYEHSVIAIQSVKDAVMTPKRRKSVVLDEQIVKEWNDLLLDIEQNEDENVCKGVHSEYVDSCPKVQKLAFVMRCYEYYLGKSCKIDEIDDEPKSYSIKSMSDIVHGLNGLNLQSLLNIYEHVSTEHFNSELFEYFATNFGKCEGGNHCKSLSRNRRHRGIENKDINTSINVNDAAKEKEIFRAISRQRTLLTAADSEYVGIDGKAVNDEERITLSYLDKWHSFLFHNDKENCDDESDDLKYEMLHETEAKGPGNKFVTDVLNSSFNVFQKSKSNENLNGDAGDEYYEYGFGSQIKYHTLSPNFVCMKDELLGNEIYAICEKIWNDNLSKALLCLKMECVQTKFKANDHGNFREYGIAQNDAINIDNVIAILFYCNFDIFQNEFSKTFRRQSPMDSEHDIIDRHCTNFYWFGRALFVAINFYGQRMSKDTVVWHGLSSKMLFEDFAAYFDCPTSTTTQKNVAQKFSGNGSGIILRLKSKHTVNCAYMLDVSVFSDFTDECERLFLNETLIITDILCIERHQWTSYKKYIDACLYFSLVIFCYEFLCCVDLICCFELDKITTGHSLDEDWNIKESKKIQETLAQIILDYMTDGNVANGKKVPIYIRNLFKHYCVKHDKPLFNGLDKIQLKMVPELQQLFFDLVIIKEEQFKDDGMQKIATKKVKELFPNAVHFINDQGQLISMEDDVEIVMRKQTTLSPTIRPIRKVTLRVPGLNSLK